ncbi:MAG: ATP-binding protein [Pseudomonas sp.]|nr:ATP-binding protein [Pseudomonas sp.]
MAKLETSSASVRNEFNKFSSEKVLSEYIWNAFDADATEVSVKYFPDELGAIQSLSITDNGTGIDPESHEKTFGAFKDSPKRKYYSPTIRGKKGLGRFSFHKIARYVIWDSVTENNSCSIKIDSDSLNNYDVNKKRDIFQPAKTGTRIEFFGVAENNISEYFIEKSVKPQIKQEFSWLLASTLSRKIYFNGEPIDILNHSRRSIEVEVSGENFSTTMILWEEKPKEESYIYFEDSSGRIIFKQLSGLNRKHGFYPSIYSRSSFFDKFDFLEGDLFSITNEHDGDIFREIISKVDSFVRDVYNDFRAKAADKLIEQYESEGLFPEHEDDSFILKKWKLDSLKETIRVLYSAEPSLFSSHLNKTQKKILVKLLDKITVSPTDDLFDVLNGVVSLDSDDQKKLASILKETSLGSVANAIAEIKSRQQVIEIINSLNEDHTKETKETKEIQTIVESNLWLFGEKYHLLTAEEPDFEDALRAFLEIGGNEDYYQKNTILHPDKNKEMDIFAVRRNYEVDEAGREFYRCLVVELKRPSDTLKDNHFEQIQKYFKVINSNHQFNDGLHKWDFILSGRKITEKPFARTMIDSALENSKGHGEPGLLMKAGNFKIYIKPWNQLFSEHNIRHKHLLKHLKFEKGVSGDRKKLISDAVEIGKKMTTEPVGA